MTRPKRWPNYAEEHREMAFRRAGEICALCEQTQRLVNDGASRQVVLAGLLQIVVKAKDIQLHLIQAKEGVE